MTTKKQAARDRKRRVHGWEGDPVEAPEPVAATRSPRKPTAGSTAKGASAGSKTASATASNGRRIHREGDAIVYGRQRVQRPTWRRTVIRTAVFLPVMFIIVHFLFSSASMGPRDELVLIVGYAVVTIGVMHLTETWRYNRLDRQLSEQSAGRKRR